MDEPPSKRQTVVHSVQCYDYDFTHFGDNGTLPSTEGFVASIRPLFKKWVFQKEQCPLTGRLHYQGRGSLHKKKRHGELCNLLNETELRGMHVTEASNNSRQQELFYMMKYDTRVDGPWSDKTWRAPVFIPRQYEGLLERLYPWQQAVLDSRDKFNCRSVNMIIDVNGCAGKSTCAALGDLHYGGLDLPPVGDHKELLQCACDILMAKEERKPGLVFVDLPRSLTTEPKKMAPFMVAIEQIKKGKVFDMRFHYKEWWFNSPQVWVFANHPPNPDYMSADRWRFFVIDQFKNLRQISKDEVSQMSHDQHK